MGNRQKYNAETNELKCSMCEEWKPATQEFFTAEPRVKTGCASRCRVCSNAAGRASKVKHADKVKVYNKEWWDKHPEKRSEYVRNYYWRDPQRVKDRQQKYYYEDPERSAAIASKYYYNNRDKAIASTRKGQINNPVAVNIRIQRRRSKANNLPATFTKEDWESALNHFDNRCAVCGRSESEYVFLAQDHWQPLIKDGAYTADNIVPLCHARKGYREYPPCCNNSKREKSPMEWLTKRFGIEKARLINERIQAYFTEVKNG